MDFSSTVECVGESLAIYQYYSADAFHPSGESIDAVFDDGIVLTHGTPRTHVWTFACGYSQYYVNPYGCPCNSNSYSHPLPPFVGNDNFCESGHKYNSVPPANYLTNNPLWDGAGCVSGTCCNFHSPPWFCKTLSHPTIENIKLRLCTDQRSAMKMFFLKKWNFAFSELLQ